MWLQMTESLAGPGNGAPDLSNPPEQEINARAKDDALKGVGAFNHLNNLQKPPTPGNSPTGKYLDPRFPRRCMRKK